MRRFTQLDVFSGRFMRGNALAVVHDADDVSDADLAAFARWTNLSETTFLLRPRAAEADYRVRIFTPAGELPFAGHPTLGSAAAWLEAGGVPTHEGRVVQECGVGLVHLRREGDRLAFAAPPLIRSGEPDAVDRDRAVRSLGVDASRVVAAQWVDNGPGWLGILLDGAQTVLELAPDFTEMGTTPVGVIGPSAMDGIDYEVRAFVPGLGVPEDPVTGSLNAGLAGWLIGSGRAPTSYVVRQGTALGRDGRVHLDRVGGEIWVGGQVAAGVTGQVAL